MATCPKCFKQNPADAVFCGFCGAKILEKDAEGAGVAKTMFGYNLDPNKLAGAQAVAPSPSPTPETAEPVPPAQPAGQRGLVAGKYQLGQGPRRVPAGELYLTNDPSQPGDLELLLVDKAVFQSPLDMERARRELRQLQKVECPAIVRVVDHGKAEDERLFVVMERVDGATLDGIVSSGALDLPEAQRVIKGVGVALAEAQKMGVIHRDIAPHNVIIAADGEVRVRGFGVAAPIKRHVSGTPEFISPEQASGRPVDQRSNIYSLGALMFYMLTGTPPFEGNSVDEILSKHQKDEPVSPKKRRPDLQLPGRAEALILKALAKSSSRRHLTLRQFLREVDSIAVVTGPHDEVTDAPPVSFETPLHGVTALQGGSRPPPSSELAPLRPPPADDGPTLSDVGPEARTPVAPAGMNAAASAPEPASVAPLAQPAPDPAAPKRMSQATGELSSDVKLKPADQQAAPKPVAPKPVAPKPAAAAPGAPAAAPAGKAAFRETMWFYKGEVESAMAEEGGEEVAKPEDEASPDELAAKYADDGSLSDEAARRLSLRTGKTQMMQQVNVPKGHLPGERMADKELIGEISGNRTLIYISAAILLAGIGGLVAYLVLS